MTELPPITDEDRQFLHYNPNTADVVAWVRAYAEAAVKAEREACAALCDTRSADHWHDYQAGPTGMRGVTWHQHSSTEAEACAAAIRAMGE